MITDEWIQFVIDNPVKETVQTDGRIRRWAPIKAMDGKYLRVILLPMARPFIMHFSIEDLLYENQILRGNGYPVY